MQITLPWGHEILTLALPEDWRLNGVYEPAVGAQTVNPLDAAERALAAPVGSPRLSELVKPGARVVVVIDDGSRPTPVAQMMPAAWAELRRAGVTGAGVTVLPALGLHRPMSEEEIMRRAGPLPEGVRTENPDCDDPQKLAYLGTTSRGTPVWVNRTVAEADVIVSVGCIEPHIIASFGGGYKNIVPGVAGRATVAHNHALNCAPATFNMVGQAIERNPMRLDLEEAAAMVKGKVFVINTILNHCQEVIQVVAGDPVAAHRAGAAASAALYGVKVSRAADVVITTSHPMDSDLRQGVKALANTIRAVKPGGAMITLVRAEEGVGVFGLANRKLPLGRGALQILAPALLRVVPKIKLKGMGEEDRFFLYFALQAMRRARLLMYAPTIPAATQENLPFVTFAPSVEAAVDMARVRLPRGAEVAVFPHGGITYPLVEAA